MTAAAQIQIGASRTRGKIGAASSDGRNGRDARRANATPKRGRDLGRNGRSLALYLTSGLFGSVVVRAIDGEQANAFARRTYGDLSGPFFSVQAKREDLQQQVREGRCLFEADGREIGFAETYKLAGLAVPRANVSPAERGQVASKFLRRGVLPVGQTNAERAEAYAEYLFAAGFVVSANVQCAGFIDGIDTDRARAWISDVLFQMPRGRSAADHLAYLTKKLRRRH